MTSYSNMPLYLYGNKCINNSQGSFPLWNAINSNQQEFYEVEVFDDRNDEQGKLKNIDGIMNMTTYTCHICNIDVPKTYTKEHIKSVKHEACLKITNIALERTHIYMKSYIPEPSLKVEVEGTYFCENCATIVQNCDYENHILSRNHINSVENDKLLQKLMSVYEDSETDYGENDSFHLSEDYLEQMNSMFYDALSSDVAPDIASIKEPNVTFDEKNAGNIKEIGNTGENREISATTNQGKNIKPKQPVIQLLKYRLLTEKEIELSAANNNAVKKKKLKQANENNITEKKSNADYSQMVYKKAKQCEEECTSSECNVAKTYKKTDAEKSFIGFHSNASKPLNKDEFQIKEVDDSHVEKNKLVIKKKDNVKKNKKSTKELKINSNTGYVLVFDKYEQYGTDSQSENDKKHEEEKQNDKQKQNEKNKQNDTDTVQNEKSTKSKKDKQNEKDKSQEEDKQQENDKKHEKEKSHEKDEQNDKQYEKHQQNDKLEQNEKEEQSETDIPKKKRARNNKDKQNEKNKSHEQSKQCEKGEQNDKQKQNDKQQENDEQSDKQKQNGKQKQNYQQHEIEQQDEKPKQNVKKHEKDTQEEKNTLIGRNKLHEKEEQIENEKEKQNGKESSSKCDEAEKSSHLIYLSAYLAIISNNCQTLKVKALSESEINVKVVDGEKATVPLINFHGYDIVGDGAIVCRICRGTSVVNAEEHQWDEEHIAKVMTPVDKQFMRKLDDTFSHCILCNTLHLSAESAFHVNHIVHKTNRQNSQQWKQDQIAQLIHLDFRRRCQK